MGLFNRRKGQKKLRGFEEINAETVAEDFMVQEKKICTDPYLQHAWASVCIDILTRNIARAEFEIRRDGKVVSDCELSRLFRYPNEYTSHFDL